MQDKNLSKISIRKRFHKINETFILKTMNTKTDKYKRNNNASVIQY